MSQNLIHKTINLQNVNFKSIKKYLEDINFISKLKICGYVYPNINIIHNSVLSSSTECFNYSLTSLFTVNSFDKQQIIYIIGNICKSTEFIHFVGINNGNIHPNNILFNNNNEIHICDYCLNRIRNKNHISLENYKYLNPEYISNKKVIDKSDVWSIGLILFQLIKGYNLIEGKSISEIETSILESETIIENLKSDEFLIKLINKCIKVDSNNRINIKELLLELNIESNQYYSDRSEMIYNSQYNSLLYLIKKRIKSEIELTINERCIISNDRKFLRGLYKYYESHPSIYSYCLIKTIEWNNECYNSIVINNNYSPDLNFIIHISKEYRKIDFSKVNSNYIPHKLEILCENIKLFYNLKYLYFNNQLIGDDNVKKVIDNLSHLEVLEELNLYNNNLTNITIEYMSSNLKIHSSLKNINFSDNLFTKAVESYVIDVLKLLPNIKKFALNGERDGLLKKSLSFLYPLISF